MLQARLSARRWWLLTLAGGAGFLALWTGLALSGIVPSIFLPTPWAVLRCIAGLTREPFAGATLQGHLASSLLRFGLGFTLAVCAGIPLGLLMAWFRVVDKVLTPLFDALRFVAPIAWLPFAALWFGTGIGGPLLIIFMGAFPPVLINTYRGAKYVDRKYLDAARMLGAGSWRSITQVLLPAAVPSIVAGLRVSTGLGWQSLVGAELIVASSGVGYLMVRGQAGLSSATVMGAMCAIGLVGLSMDWLLRRIQQAIETRRGLP